MRRVPVVPAEANGLGLPVVGKTRGMLWLTCVGGVGRLAWMDLQLKGKHAIVTGSTAGIGLAVAEALIAEGARVVINGRTEDRVQSAVAGLKGRHPDAQIQGVAADLGTADGCEVLFRAVPTTEILVNNLGIFESKPFVSITDQDWTHIFDVNVLSGVRLSRHYLLGMYTRGTGRVIFISSESGLQIPAEMIHYGVTKTAQLALSRGLAEATRGTKITVNSILPGPTRSEGVGQFLDGLAAQQGKDPLQVEREFFTQMRPSSLIRRFETPAEIAALVAFVASPRASGINGAALRVDGGVVRSIA
jgi:NAD(P)-dependent dehydrogenase (short-subunit alcohol dehydrogenase family)